LGLGFFVGDVTMGRCFYVFGYFTWPFSDTGTHTRGFFQTTVHTTTLPRRAWVWINRLRTGVGRFRSCLYKCGMASSKAATSKKFRGVKVTFGND